MRQQLDKDVAETHLAGYGSASVNSRQVGPPGTIC
jgi:hypothetical protein